jgi:hypothetical protein
MLIEHLHPYSSNITCQLPLCGLITSFLRCPLPESTPLPGILNTSTIFCTLFIHSRPTTSCSHWYVCRACPMSYWNLRNVNSNTQAQISQMLQCPEEWCVEELNRPWVFPCWGLLLKGLLRIFPLKRQWWWRPGRLGSSSTLDSDVAWFGTQRCRCS